MRKPVTGASVWTSESIFRSPTWIHELSPEEVEEVSSALTRARADYPISELTAERFPLPRIAPVLKRAQTLLEDGPGLFLLRGLPCERLSKEEMRYIYWGLGTHLGTAVSQSADGDVLGDVRNIGLNRIYTSNRRGGFHTDSSDVVGLLVLRAAKSGGLTQVASAAAVHNEMLRTRPDLVEELYQPFCWSWIGTQSADELPFFRQPIFSTHRGNFSCCYIPALIRQAQSFPGVPKLAERQTEAMKVLEATAEDERFHFSMHFEAGDLQLLNNHVCIHARTAFEDWEDEERRRHLLRLWLSTSNNRELGPDRSEYWDVRSGAVRAGFGRGRPPIFETTGEQQT